MTSSRGDPTLGTAPSRSKRRLLPFAISGLLVGVLFSLVATLLADLPWSSLLTLQAAARLLVTSGVFAVLAYLTAGLKFWDVLGERFRRPR